MIEKSGVDFEVIDIREDESAFVYVVDHLEASSTPVIESDVYGALIFGFTEADKPRLQAFIDAESAPTVYGDGTWLH
jgi:hypothetical protein